MSLINFHFLLILGRWNFNRSYNGWNKSHNLRNSFNMTNEIKKGKNILNKCHRTFEKVNNQTFDKES